MTPIDQPGRERLLAAGYTAENTWSRARASSLRARRDHRRIPADAARCARVFDDELIPSARRLRDEPAQPRQYAGGCHPPASEAPVPQEGTGRASARLLLGSAGRQEAAAQKGGAQKDDEASLADLPLEAAKSPRRKDFCRENRTMERFGEKLRAAVGQMQNGEYNRVLEKFINLLPTDRRRIYHSGLHESPTIVVVDEPERFCPHGHGRAKFGPSDYGGAGRGEVSPGPRTADPDLQDEALAAMRRRRCSR